MFLIIHIYYNIHIAYSLEGSRTERCPQGEVDAKNTLNCLGGGRISPLNRCRNIIEQAREKGASSQGGGGGNCVHALGGMDTSARTS